MWPNPQNLQFGMGQVALNALVSAVHLWQVYHNTLKVSSACAGGSIGTYSMPLQPNVELPDSAEGEPAGGGDTGGGEGVSCRGR